MCGLTSGKAMRTTVLQIIPELETGGAELSTVEIAGAVVAAGGRAIVLTEGGRLAPMITAAGGEVIPFPAASKNPLVILVNGWRIAAIARRERAAILHARSRAPAWSALIASRLTGIPLVTTYHGAYRERGLLKRLYNSVMARGRIVIANSGYTSRLVQSRYGTPEGRIRVIYRGVDGGAFDPAAVSPDRVEALRAAWGVGPAARIVLNAARLTAWKGQGVIIEAARLLNERGRLGDSVVVLAGDAQGRDGYCERLQSEIAAAGLDGRVLLVGHVDDMAAAMKAAHLAIVASTGPEAFGRTATEAQVMQCPVIATAIGAPPETVLACPNVSSDRRTGWLVPPGDAAALAGAMAEALSLSEEERRAMGERARAHVLSAFTLDGMRAETLDVYAEVLGRKTFG
jgi:glycosyltransferase involved in cell wall biosynthesis